MILSQLIRGAAEELVSRPGELIDPVLVGAAMARGAQRAYASVRQPAEGTILTVMRDMATAVALELARGADAQLAPDADAVEQDRRIADVLERAIVAGEESVRRGPELLPALREAGVVDAGGYGVVVLFAGCVAALRGESAPEVAHHHAPARVTHPEHESSTFRFCTNFAVTATGDGELADADSYVALLEAIGDSVLVVGDHVTLRVHVHTDEPEVATGIFDGGRRGLAARRRGHARAGRRPRPAARRRRAARAPDQHCGALAIVSGARAGGDVPLARLRRARRRHDDEPVDLRHPRRDPLGSGRGGRRAAEQPQRRDGRAGAADMSDKVVRVVRAASSRPAWSPRSRWSPSAARRRTRRRCSRRCARVRTGQVAPAAREDAQGRFAVGDAVGYVGDELVAWGEPDATLVAVSAGSPADAELLTVITGHGAPLDGAAIEALVPDGVEFELADGGQPSRWWLLSAE